MSWREKFFDEVEVRGEPIPRFSRFPLENRPLHSLRPRVCSDYFSLEDILVFWRSGAYKKYPRSYGADHRVCGGHCPTSGHSGPRTPVNDLKQQNSLSQQAGREEFRSADEVREGVEDVECRAL